MDVEFYEKIKVEFPEILPDSAINISIPKGWHDLVYSLLKELYALSTSVRVYQIKSKFGELRCNYATPSYLEYTHQEAGTIIRRYEVLSQMTCEICGNSATPKYWRNNIWCDKCREEATKK